MSNHRGHQSKRKQPTPEEEEVDDLLIASMAVASTWMPQTTAVNVDGSDSSESKDDGKDDSYRDADEISIDESNNEEETTDVNETASNDNASIEKTSTSNESDPSNPKVDSDDESDIDLTENLANMLDEEDEPNKRNNNTKSYGIYQGPKTEHEIDPYSFPITDELEKLSVQKTDGIDEKSRLRVAGTVRSYLVDQRTIVVDSLVPVSLQQNAMEALDEGSVMAILLKDGKAVTTLEEASSMEIIGTVVEVFGPVQRPLYVIRLPEAKLEEVSEKKEDATVVDKSKDVDCETDKSTSGSNNVISETHESLGANDIEDNQDIHETNEQDSNGAEQTAEKRKETEISKKVNDPWSVNGRLSSILRSTPNAAVYAVIDHSNLINKEHIIKISGKGCDASNMFDEEVGPSELQDFSDDEDERNAKKGNRKPRQSNQSNNNNSSARAFNGGRGGGRGRGRGRGRSQSNNSFTANPHHMQQQPLYPQQHAPVQQQYYNQNALQAQQMYPQQSYQQYHQSGQSIYQQPYQPPQYNHGAFIGYNYGVPPPPPPQQHNATQYSQQHSGNTTNPTSSISQNDTVYYDYSGS